MSLYFKVKPLPLKNAFSYYCKALSVHIVICGLLALGLLFEPIWSLIIMTPLTITIIILSTRANKKQNLRKKVR